MAKKSKLQSVSGMHDILPIDQNYYARIYEVVSNIAGFYGFGKIDTPAIEYTELFDKGIGSSTDIVDKEMYSFKTKGGDMVSLRPEWTAPVVRAYIEHGMYALPQPLKLWYSGFCWRHERPQEGRYRQFTQFGFEVFGEASPVIDAQIIQISYNILKELKLKDITVEINSIGDSNCRPYYKKLLSNYLKSRESSLCATCKKRAKENVLRVLDCKDEKCQPIKTEAPQIIDHLCDGCHSHFKEVLEFLDEIEVPYNLNPYLVRGLDYYTKTVFEINSNKSEEKSLSLAAGGRYDRLVKMLGGRDTFACGVGFGIERIISLMKSQNIEPAKPKEVDVFLAQLGSLAKRKSLKLLEEFRKAKIGISESFGRDSLKVQLNRANKLEAKYALILGQKEALDDVVIIRDMESGKQSIVKTDKAVSDVRKKLKK